MEASQCWVYFNQMDSGDQLLGIVFVACHGQQTFSILRAEEARAWIESGTPFDSDASTPMKYQRRPLLNALARIPLRMGSLLMAKGSKPQLFREALPPKPDHYFL